MSDRRSRSRTGDLLRIREALCQLSYPPWARLGSNQQPLVCKTSALPLELLARAWTGRESNPRTTASFAAATTATRPLDRTLSAIRPMSSGTRDRTSISTFRAWRPAVRRSRIARTSAAPGRPLGGARQTRCPSVQLPRREIDAAAAPSGQTMLSMPLAYPSTLDRRSPIREDRRPTWRSFGARASTVCEKAQAKADANSERIVRAQTPRVFLSQAGPRFGLELLQAEHHLWFRQVGRSPSQQKRRPHWVALVWLVCAHDYCTEPPVRAAAGTGRPFGSNPCLQGPLQAADVASAMYISMVNEVNMSRSRTIDEVAAIRKGSKRRFNNRSEPPVRKPVEKVLS